MKFVMGILICVGWIVGIYIKCWLADRRVRDLRAFDHDGWEELRRMKIDHDVRRRRTNDLRLRRLRKAYDVHSASYVMDHATWTVDGQLLITDGGQIWMY